MIYCMTPAIDKCTCKEEERADRKKRAMLNQTITKGNSSNILILARERQFGIRRGSSNIL